MQEKNKKIWRRIGIVTLWFSGVYLITFAPYNNMFLYGLYIGQGLVYLMWAIKETITEHLKYKSDLILSSHRQV